ncbi:retroviral-like aspartic protease family protein [Candidatus Woesearchaeota archaeon]|nr:retroviral-like aspartic protease family protein [Candidatus Woesearchaeota archaeon]
MTDLIVDTGADRSMISYRFGIELGLEAPGEKDITKIVKTADNRDVHYIERKVDLHIGEKLDLNNFKICWCSKPGVNYNFLGMDILSSLKLILVKKEFYLVDPDHCVGCKK